MRRDYERVRQIFLSGGQRGNPLRTYVDDETLALRVLVDYYLRRARTSCFVAESAGTVVAVLLGTGDTRAYLRYMAVRVAPSLIARVVLKTLTGQYSHKTFQVIRWALLRSWREVPSVDLRRYPAHLHLSVAAGSRGARVGREILWRFFRHCTEAGLPGVHGFGIEEWRRHGFAGALGFVESAAKRTTLWRHISHRDWAFKLLTMDLRPLRARWPPLVPLVD